MFHNHGFLLAPGNSSWSIFVAFHHRYLVAAIDFQSLDRVSAYTAERANEPLSARLGSFRAARVETCLRSPFE